MKRPTLDEFLTKSLMPANQYVSERGWRTLYVRRMRHLLGDRVQETIDLANIAAKVAGKGTFKKLVRKLRRKWPELTIYVENVITFQFRDGLRRMGFAENGSSFYLLPQVKQ